ncbi:MAG: LamG-like jellyroll fold domain-containing protein, partial [Bacteroidales bacterium]
GAYYIFNETSGTQIKDYSGNERHAYWYQYWGDDVTTETRSGWRPDSGIFDGAGYLPGDHAFCPDNCPDPESDCTCSSGTDLFIFSSATDENSECDDATAPPSPDFFQAEQGAFTLAFWYKNDWDYFCPSSAPKHYCADDDSKCAWERQVLWSYGDESNGLTLEITPDPTYGAVLYASINGNVDGGAQKIGAVNDDILLNKWIHIAVTFEGNETEGTGVMKLYLNGELQRETETPFSKIESGNSSAVFGGENQNSVSGFNVNDYCWGTDNPWCGITPTNGTANTLRYGWPAMGYLDELAYWNDLALTVEQIAEFMENGCAECRPATNTSLYKRDILQNAKIVPNFASSYISIDNVNTNRNFSVDIINIAGKNILSLENVSEGQQIILPDNMQDGLYFCRITDPQKAYVSVKKFVLNR